MNWPLGAIRTIEEIEAIARTVKGKPHQSISIYLVQGDYSGNLTIVRDFVRPGCTSDYPEIKLPELHVDGEKGRWLNGVATTTDLRRYNINGHRGDDHNYIFRNYFMAYGYIQRVKSDQQKSNSEVSG